MALLPCLTTSNRVLGSAPSPFWWATPFGLLPPLSTGDLRAFLLATWQKQTDQKEWLTECIEDSNECNQLVCSAVVVLLLVFQACLSFSCLFPPQGHPAHLRSCSDSWCRLARHLTSPCTEYCKCLLTLVCNCILVPKCFTYCNTGNSELIMLRLLTKLGESREESPSDAVNVFAIL